MLVNWFTNDLLLWMKPWSLREEDGHNASEDITIVTMRYQSRDLQRHLRTGVTTQWSHLTAKVTGDSDAFNPHPGMRQSIACCSNQHTVKWIQSVSDQISRAVGNVECWLDGGIDGALRPCPSFIRANYTSCTHQQGLISRFIFCQLPPQYSVSLCESFWFMRRGPLHGEKDPQTWFCCIIFRVPSKITEHIFVECL